MKLKNSLQISALLAALFLNACFDKPGEFVSPTWDVDLNIPITKKNLRY